MRERHFATAAPRASCDTEIFRTGHICSLAGSIDRWQLAGPFANEPEFVASITPFFPTSRGRSSIFPIDIDCFNSVLSFTDGARVERRIEAPIALAFMQEKLCKQRKKREKKLLCWNCDLRKDRLEIDYSLGKTDMFF